MEKEDERGPQSPELENNATSNVFFITKKRVPEELKAKNTKKFKHSEKDSSSENDNDDEEAKKGFELSAESSTVFKKMIAESDKRNPDIHECDMYNDFYAYGCIEVIENELKTICSALNKKNYTIAFDFMCAVCSFAGTESSWMGADDGERVSKLYEFISTIMGAIHKGLADTGKRNCLKRYKEFEPFLQSFETSAKASGLEDEAEPYWPWTDNYEETPLGDAIARFKQLYKTYGFTGKKTVSTKHFVITKQMIKDAALEDDFF